LERRLGDWQMLNKEKCRCRCGYHGRKCYCRKCDCCKKEKCRCRCGYHGRKCYCKKCDCYKKENFVSRYRYNPYGELTQHRFMPASTKNIYNYGNRCQNKRSYKPYFYKKNYWYQKGPKCVCNDTGCYCVPSHFST